MTDFFVPKFKIIKANTLDELILKAIKFIVKKGKFIDTKAGRCQQAYSVTYVLLNSKNRVHWLRAPKSVEYLAKELLAFFDGSLNINDGLLQASSFWKKIANDKDYVFSNYGFYVFHQKLKDYNSQYEWLVSALLENSNTRRAVININQAFHKVKNSKDFPCVISLHFFIIENTLYCSVFARSSDVFFGLPYDIGFFSFIHELLLADLKQKDFQNFENLSLGAMFVKTQFTQIYDFSRQRVLDLLKTKVDKTVIDKMPSIDDDTLVLNDIYNHESKSPIMKWIYDKCGI